MDGDSYTIYVYLVGAAVDVSRLVEAIQLSGDALRIVGDNQDPYGERWQFNSDDVVHCQREVFPGGQSELVAAESFAGAI